MSPPHLLDIMPNSPLVITCVERRVTPFDSYGDDSVGITWAESNYQHSVEGNGGCGFSLSSSTMEILDQRDELTKLILATEIEEKGPENAIKGIRDVVPAVYLEFGDFITQEIKKKWADGRLEVQKFEVYMIFYNSFSEFVYYLFDPGGVSISQSSQEFSKLIDKKILSENINDSKTKFDISVDSGLEIPVKLDIAKVGHNHEGCFHILELDKGSSVSENGRPLRHLSKEMVQSLTNQFVHQGNVFFVRPHCLQHRLPSYDPQQEMYSKFQQPNFVNDISNFSQVESTSQLQSYENLDQVNSFYSSHPIIISSGSMFSKFDIDHWVFGILTVIFESQEALHLLIVVRIVSNNTSIKGNISHWYEKSYMRKSGNKDLQHFFWDSIEYKMCDYIIEGNDVYEGEENQDKRRIDTNIDTLWRSTTHQEGVHKLVNLNAVAEFNFIRDGANGYQIWLDIEKVLEPLFYSMKKKCQSKESIGGFTNSVCQNLAIDLILVIVQLFKTGRHFKSFGYCSIDLSLVIEEQTPLVEVFHSDNFKVARILSSTLLGQSVESGAENLTTILDYKHIMLGISFVQVYQFVQGTEHGFNKMEIMVVSILHNQARSLVF